MTGGQNPYDLYWTVTISPEVMTTTAMTTMTEFVRGYDHHSYDHHDQISRGHDHQSRRNAYLGDPQVHGVVPAAVVHLLGQQAVRLYHHQRVAGLHAEQKVVVVCVSTDVRKLKRRLHHPSEAATQNTQSYQS
jgi:hypothetical protein